MLEHGGMILWFTGLPAAGKTTVATRLYERLKAEGARVHLLDGDVIRALSKGRIGFTREERITHMMQVGHTALSLKERGMICIVAMIAPYADARELVFGKIGALEIFVDSPLEVCQARDPKGLYARAIRGEIKNFTGISDVYEPPSRPRLQLHTELESPEESTERVFQDLYLSGLIGDQGSFLEKVYEA